MERSSISEEIIATSEVAFNEFKEEDKQDTNEVINTERPFSDLILCRNNSTVCDGVSEVVLGSPTTLTPTRIVRSELLQNVKLDVYLKINEDLPDRVFCIDGGGVKGIVEAVILKYLHYCLQRHHAGDGENVLDDLKALIKYDVAIFDGNYSIPVPDEAVLKYDASAEPHIHKMFDIVAGTSTGSIIATAISRLHWNPQQLIDTSKVIAPIIFPKPYGWNLYGKLKKSILSGLSLLTNGINKYSVEPLEKYLEKTIGHTTWDSSNHDGNNKDGATSNAATTTQPILGIITIREDNAQVKIFNSVKYKHSQTVTIKDAIRASTAAPTYFSSYRIIDDLSETNKGKTNVEDMESFAYVDGGLSANCPANYTMGLLQGPKYQLACLISIGCGDDMPTYLPLARVVQMAMNNEESWNSFYKSHPRVQPFLYRITPSKQSGIGSYDLADSHKVDEMEKKYIKSLLNDDEDTERYLHEMVRSTTCLFAKSLHIAEATLKFNPDINMYVFRVVVETRYNEKKYEYNGETLRGGPPQVLSFKRNVEDGDADESVSLLKPINIVATLDKHEDTIKFEYQGYEICGSPILISRKLTMYTEEEVEIMPPLNR